MAVINSNTVLCLHCNGVDGTTTFVDSSPLANTMTTVNDAQIDTAKKKFGTASGLFDGTSVGSDTITGEIETVSVGFKDHPKYPEGGTFDITLP